VVRQGLHHLHAVVEDPGDLQYPGAVAQGLGQLLGGDFAVGQEHRGGHPASQVSGVKGGGRRGVAGGGADGQELAGPGLAHQVVEIAQGRGHAPVFERGAGVLAVVFIIKGPADFFPQRIIGRHLRGVAFPQVDDVLKGNDRGNQFVKEKDPFQGRQVEHLAVIEQAAPKSPGVLLEAVGGLILQEEESPALRAGVEQPADVVLRPAFETAIYQIAFRLRYEKGPDIVGKLFGSQPFFFLSNQSRLDYFLFKKPQFNLWYLIPIFAF